MNKLKILSILAITLALILVISLNPASAYSHATFQVSDNIVFKEDIKGENRGFSLRRSTDVPRWTDRGYVDWSAYPDPRNVRYPRTNSYRVSDRLALEGFRTFQQDSQAQNRLELERERNRNFFSFSFRPRFYGGYGGYRGYGSYGSFYRY